MHRARPGQALVLITLVVAGACTGAQEEPQLLLLPTEPAALDPVGTPVLQEIVGEDLAAALPDVRSATVIDEVPAETTGCGAEQASRWSAPPRDSAVVVIPEVGFTYSRTGPTPEGGVLTVVCDAAPDGTVLAADELQVTGTDQPVGNDYITRVGTISGRVDVGIPEGASVALQRFEEWTLLVPLPDDMALLRLHALAGGSPAEGYDVGTVTFLTADGEDVTTESIPIPDVVHGVPRDRGSAVDD